MSKLHAEPLQIRVERLERCLGTLLTFLAANEFIGPEDFETLESLRHPIQYEVPTAPTTPGLQPEVPF